VPLLRVGDSSQVRLGIQASPPPADTYRVKLQRAVTILLQLAALTGLMALVGPNSSPRRWSGSSPR
jgi:hypothetical protein